MKHQKEADEIAAFLDEIEAKLAKVDKDLAGKLMKEIRTKVTDKFANRRPTWKTNN